MATAAKPDVEAGPLVSRGILHFGPRRVYALHSTKITAVGGRRGPKTKGGTDNFFVHFGTGIVTWHSRLGLFSASAPQGQRQTWLGYFRTIVQAKNAVLRFEAAEREASPPRDSSSGRTKRAPVLAADEKASLTPCLERC